jgi:hypothetical protein
VAEGEPPSDVTCYCAAGSVHPQCPTHAKAWLDKMRGQPDQTRLTEAEQDAIENAWIISPKDGPSGADDPMYLAVESILAAHVEPLQAGVELVTALAEAQFAGIRCALVHWQPEGVTKAVSCANCQSWAANIAMPFFRAALPTWPDAALAPTPPSGEET